MTESQLQLQNALTTTFLANLAFLSEYDNELYHRVDELSRMIENGTYKERYALEFNMQDGDFDIYDIVNDKYLYNKSPKKFNDNLVRKSEQYEGNYILNLPEHFSPIHKNVSIIDKTNRFDFEHMPQFNTLSVNNAWEYVNAIGDYINNKKKRLKTIKKFIFLGTLLGRHIPKIAEKIDASSYLVLERNLEIFRLSLFTVDYTILAKKGAIFSIMDNIQEEKKIYTFLDVYKIDNYFLKLSITNINISQYIDTILNLLLTLNPTAYDYNRRLYIHTNRTTRRIKEGYKFLDFKKIKDNSNFFENRPILYIAAGPSLDDNLEWVKKNQNKFFIVCIGRALKKLVDNEIRVDVVATLDEQEFLADTQFDDETMGKLGKNTLLFAGSITNENVLNKFDKKNIFIFEVFYCLYKGNSAYGGFSIGEIALHLLLEFKPKEIFILGLDLALNQKTGATHSTGNTFGTSQINLDEEQDRSNFDIRSSLVKVKGNFIKEVYTTPIFYGSIKMLEDIVRRKDKSIKIYNLSKNGARFGGVMPKKTEQIDLKKYKDIYDLKIDDYLNSNSFTSLNEFSKDAIKKEIKYINTKLEKELKTLENLQNILYEEFVKEIEEILIELSKNNFLNIRQIITLYCELYFPYLAYYFNDKNIKAERNKVNKIKEIFINQIRNLLYDYTECLKRVV